MLVALAEMHAFSAEAKVLEKAAEWTHTYALCELALAICN